LYQFTGKVLGQSYPCGNQQGHDTQLGAPYAKFVVQFGNESEGWTGRALLDITPETANLWAVTKALRNLRKSAHQGDEILIYEAAERMCGGQTAMAGPDA